MLKSLKAACKWDSYLTALWLLFSNNLNLGRCDPESSRLREMVKNDYVEIGELGEDAFGDSCVYVRRY